MSKAYICLHGRQMAICGECFPQEPGMSDFDAAWQRLEQDCEHMIGMEEHRADIRLLLSEVKRLKAELEEATAWKDKMTDVAGSNRERAEEPKQENP